MGTPVDFLDIQYIDLQTAKKWLNVNDSFEDDDMLIYGLIDAAQAAAEKYLDKTLDEIAKDGVLPSAVKQAILFLVGTWYSQRESISGGNLTQVPHTFELLCDLYRNYDCNEAILKTSN